MKCCFKLRICVFICCAIMLLPSFYAHGQSDMGIGIPIGGEAIGPDEELCPVGVHVVRSFIAAWGNDDFESMYELLDDDSKTKYQKEEAIFAFGFLEYKPYKISSIKKTGDDFEFVLTHGNWKDGDKELKKILINGKSNKIIMSSSSSPFKKSAVDYF